MPTLPAGSPDPVGSDPWISGEAIASDPRLEDTTMPAEITYEMCAEAATEYLYKRTGRRFRLHAVTFTPNLSGACGCSMDCLDTEIELPGPVDPDSIVATIAGVVLDPSAYKLYGGSTLVRTDGGYWPMCWHLSSPAGLDWSIAFTYGQLPGMDGILACRELGVHYALAACNKQSKIPARAVTLSRGGLSLNLLRGRRTGIALVDDYLDSSNPENLRGRGSVVSPDTIRLSRS